MNGMSFDIDPVSVPGGEPQLFWNQFHLLKYCHNLTENDRIYMQFFKLFNFTLYKIKKSI